MHDGIGGAFEYPRENIKCYAEYHETAHNDADTDHNIFLKSFGSTLSILSKSHAIWKCYNSLMNNPKWFSPRFAGIRTRAASVSFHFGLMFWASRTDSAIDDELAHIPAGYGYVHNLDYRLNPEHPPLVKALAMLPVSCLTHPSRRERRLANRRSTERGTWAINSFMTSGNARRRSSGPRGSCRYSSRSLRSSSFTFSRDGSWGHGGRSFPRSSSDFPPRSSLTAIT